MSSIEDKLALANANVPKTYMAGKSCKDLTDFSYFCYWGTRLDMLKYLNTSNGKIFIDMFHNCSELTTIPKLDTSSGTDFMNMFWGCRKITTIPQLDVSNGTSFTGMFNYCSELTTIPQLDVSNGTTFDTMFSSCVKLTTIPQLNTSNGKIFREMFFNCSELTTIPQLDVSNGTNFGDMFGDCEKLTTISFTGTINTSISFEMSRLLTTDSLHSIVYALADKTGSTTKPRLTLHSDSWAALEETTPPAGSSSWHEYITNVKGWTYA